MTIASFRYNGNLDGISFKFAAETSKGTGTTTVNPSQSGAKSKRVSIRVTQPKASDTVTSPLLVKGTATVFEGVLNLRLSNKDHIVLAESTTVVQGNDAPFSAVLNFAPPSSPTQGLLEVYSISPKDGRIINLVSIPVTIH